MSASTGAWAAGPSHSRGPRAAATRFPRRSTRKLDGSARTSYFQLTVFEKEDLRRLIQSMNKNAAVALPADRVNRTFDQHGPIEAW